MSIRELKQNDHQNPHKLRFDTQMEIMNTKELTKLKDKNMHLFLYEDVLVADPKQKIQSMLRPIMDCEDLATFEKDANIWNFPNVQLLSSVLEQTSGRSILERNLVIEVHETYFEKPKKNAEPVQMERFIARTKLTILDCIKYAKTGVYMLYL